MLRASEAGGNSASPPNRGQRLESREQGGGVREGRSHITLELWAQLVLRILTGTLECPIPPSEPLPAPLENGIVPPSLRLLGLSLM